MFIVMMTTATFAGSGLTVTVQGRVVSVEVVDGNYYNVIVSSEADRFVRTRPMTERTGMFMVEVPEGADSINIIATNVLTGEVEFIPVRVE